VLFATGIGAGYLAHSKPSYRSTAVVLVAPPSANESSLISNLGSANAALVTPTSPAVVRAVAKSMGTTQSVAENLGASVIAGYEGTTQLLAVTATDRVPAFAREEANDFALGFASALNGQAADELATLKKAQTRLGTQISQLSAAPQTPLVTTKLSSDTQAYATYQAQVVALEVAPTEGSIYQLASQPVSTHGSKTKILGISALSGLVAGIGLALLWERLDTRLRAGTDAPVGQAVS
jgi:capsular polysaccharide biosynthesis protein